MNYIRLQSLTNRYPQAGNYIPQKTGNSTLFGIYEETNRIDFKLSDFSEVIPIDDVSTRFIFAVTHDSSLSQIVDEDANLIETKLDVSITPKVSTNPPCCIKDKSPNIQILNFWCKHKKIRILTWNFLKLWIQYIA